LIIHCGDLAEGMGTELKVNREQGMAQTIRDAFTRMAIHDKPKYPFPSLTFPKEVKTNRDILDIVARLHLSKNS
jgi:hypothetical protein